MMTRPSLSALGLALLLVAAVAHAGKASKPVAYPVRPFYVTVKCACSGGV